MRICHVISGLRMGGAERMLLKLLSASARSRFDPLVISLLDQGVVGPDIESLGIPVVTLDLARPAGWLSSLSELRKPMRRFNPHLIQGWMYHGNLAALPGAGFATGRPPVVWNIRQSLDDIRAEKPLTQAVIRLSARLSNQPAALIYNAKTAALQHERFGFARPRRRLIANGFDTDTFMPSPTGRARLRDALGIGHDEFVIGLAARYHPMKDIDNFLRAAHGLTTRGYPARFLLAGPGMDPGNAALMTRLRTLAPHSRVQLTGICTDMPLFFQGLDLATLSSSRGEGFPNVLGEAMACGVPCVATDVGDVRHILGDTGTWVAPGDPEALAQAWSAWIDSGVTERAVQGQRARARIVTHYGLPAIVSQYETLYTELT